METYTNPNSNQHTNYTNNSTFFMNPYTSLQNIGAYRTGSLQGDYDSHVRIEVMNNNNNNVNADIDTSYENDIINNTIESTSKAHLINRNNDICQNEKGEYVYNKNVPVANNVHELSQKLHSQLHNMPEFNIITVEDIRNLMFKENITEWTKSSIKDFVQQLKYFTCEKSEFMKNIHASQSLQIQDAPPSIVNPIQERINNQHRYTQPVTIDLQNMNPQNFRKKSEVSPVIDRSINNNQQNQQNISKQPNISDSKFQNNKFEKTNNNPISQNPESTLNNPISKMQSSKKFEILSGRNRDFTGTLPQKNHYFPQHQVRNQVQNQVRNQVRNFMNKTKTAPRETIELTINSDDRNNVLYDSPFDFKILFEKEQPNEPNIKGVIYQPLENIVNIEITSLTLPKSKIDNIENYPYLLLIIPELGHCGIGSNKWLNKSIGKLYFSEKVGNFYIHTLIE